MPPPLENDTTKPNEVGVPEATVRRTKRKNANTQRLLELRCRVLEGELIKQKLQIGLLKKLLENPSNLVEKTSIFSASYPVALGGYIG